MNIGKACAVFEQINYDKYTDQEKLYAIKQVIEMPTHNGITKKAIIDAFIWFYNWVAEESKKNQSNADRIRAMSDEELGKFLNNIYELSDGSITISYKKFYDEEEIMEWLLEEVEE